MLLLFIYCLYNRLHYIYIYIKGREGKGYKYKTRFQPTTSFLEYHLFNSKPKLINNGM